MTTEQKTPPENRVSMRTAGAEDVLDEVFATAQNQDKTNYELPEEVAGDPGLSFRYVCMVNAQDNEHGLSQAIQSRFSVSRQTAWLWCRRGMGVPASQRDRLIELATTRRNTPEGLWLANGMEPEDLLRPGSFQGRPPFSRRNQFLLHLLSEVVSGKHEGLSLGSLDALVSSHLPQLGSPHRIWQWAYAQGGIPESYVNLALKGMIHHGFYKGLEADGITLEGFPKFLRTYLAAHRKETDDRKNPRPKDDSKRLRAAGAGRKRKTSKGSSPS